METKRIILKTYRYRLLPEADAIRCLFGFSDGRRWVVNECIAFAQEADLAAKGAGAKWAPNQLFSLVCLCRRLDDWCDENPWLSLCPKQVLQQAIKDFVTARANFLSGATKRPPGFLRAKEATPSLRYPQHVLLNQESIFMPKIGWVKLQNSYGRGIPLGDLRSATIKFECGNWYVSVLFAQEIDLQSAIPSAVLGIDCGVENTLTTSDGQVYQAPLMTETEAKRIRFLERRVARRTKGSNRRARAQFLLNRFRSRITRRIHDWRHKVSTSLAKNHGLIAVENLALKNMTSSARGTVEAPGTNVAQKAGLNRALLEPGFGILFSLIDYKQAWRNQTFIKVDPAYTSQRCPACGYIHADNRPTRDAFRCVRCDHTGPADAIAGRNVVWLAKENFGGRTGRICTAEPMAPRSKGTYRTPNLASAPKRCFKGIPVKAAQAA